MDPTPGIYPDIPPGEYHAAKGVSTSFLKAFANSPRKARFGEREATQALESGTLIHAAVLEPDKLDTLYQPTNLERTGTAAWEAEERMAMGRKLVKRHEFDRSRRIRDAIYGDYEARELLTGIQVEQSFWWIDPFTGVLRKGRADAVNPHFRCIVDVKTCEDSSREAFRSAVGRYKYHWQQASYTDGWQAAGGWEVHGFVFLALEKEEPFLCGKYRINPEDIDEARYDLNSIMPEVKTCLDTDAWPTRREGVVMLGRLNRSAHLRTYQENE